MTETDQPIHAERIAKVRLVRGKPVADVDALRSTTESITTPTSKSASARTVTASSPAEAPWSDTSDQGRSASCFASRLSWRCSESNNNIM